MFSGCQTWWKMTALDYHFETQPLPTPLAWFAHNSQHKEVFLALTLLAQIVIPVLAFSPIRSLRIWTAHAFILEQLGIMLSGNYNFFNILTIALSWSLYDDEFFYVWIPIKF